MSRYKFEFLFVPNEIFRFIHEIYGGLETIISSKKTSLLLRFVFLGNSVTSGTCKNTIFWLKLITLIQQHTQEDKKKVRAR